MKATLSPIVLATVLSIVGATPAMAKYSIVSDEALTDTAVWSMADAHEVWTRGKVVRVSAKRGKVTIDHGPIANLKMMAMTMPFSAADASLLEGLAAGDEIEFVADQNGDELILTNVRRPAG